MLLKTPTPEQAPEQAQKLVTATTLAQLNLDEELLNQYNSAKLVFEAAQFDEETPLNQKAQILNTLTSILQAIIKMQQDLHSIERVKLIEATLISTLQNHETLKEAFLDDYEKALRKVQ